MQNMTIGNVTAGFRVTGVYPVDRDVFAFLGDEAAAALPKESGIPFIPLYSPASKCATHVQVEPELQAIEDEQEFTEELRIRPVCVRWCGCVLGGGYLCWYLPV